MEVVSFPYATTADDLWRSILEGTIRTAAIVEGQDEATRQRVQEEFERLASEYADGSGITIPVSAKLGSGRKPGGGSG